MTNSDFSPAAIYDRELERGYQWFTYGEWYSWLATQARTVVEVGSWKGFSTVHLAKAMQQRADRPWVYSVDVWDRKGAYWRDFCSRFPVDSAEHLYGCFLWHLEREKVSGMVLPHRMASLDAAKHFQRNGRFFDAVYIDGDHSYAAVKADIQAWQTRVKPGGILAGHDFNNRDVKAAVTELLGKREVEHAKGHVWWLRVRSRPPGAASPAL